MRALKSSRPRKVGDDADVRTSVASIIQDVRTRGDEAVHHYSEQFDHSTRARFRVSRDEIEEAKREVGGDFLNDIRQAMANLRGFARAQRGTITEVRDYSPMPGIFLSDRVIPVRSCLCYVPGGRFPLYSSALMLITPAKVAGVSRICACSPVDRETGLINPKTLAAMDLAGADEIYAVGGVQAIAAFAYGTEEIRPVDMIVGPGNQYVAEAKRQCYGKVGIDFVAGPSEVLVIADETADPVTVAADLLAQAEHDPNAKAMLVTTSEPFGRAVMKAVEQELTDLPTAGTARRSWDDYGEVLVADTIDEAVDYANETAPEHLEVNVRNSETILEDLYNYGSLFLGGNTAEVFGDYASGTNHTLPTVQAARYTGGVWVGTFLKVCTHQSMTKEASATIAPLVRRMAEGEGLAAHANAAARREKE